MPAKQGPNALQHLSSSELEDLRFAKLAGRWVGLIIPLLLTVCAAILLVLWLPRLPDPMATHWGADMLADGFGPKTTNLSISLGLGGLMCALYFLQFVQSLGPRTSVWNPMQRILPATVLSAVVLIQGAALGTAFVQLDLADARDSGSTAGVLIGSAIAAVVAFVIGFFAQPSLKIELPDESEQVTPKVLGKNERAVWRSEVKPSPVLLVILGATFALMIAVTIWVFADATAPASARIILSISALLVLLLTLANLWFRVRIDPDGIVARSILGWPVVRVRSADIANVAVARIAPLDYGGWGLRIGGGRTAVVMRAGDGIVVTRKNGKIFAVSTDDARVGAELLSAYAAR